MAYRIYSHEMANAIAHFICAKFLRESGSDRQPIGVDFIIMTGCIRMMLSHKSALFSMHNDFCPNGFSSKLSVHNPNEFPELKSVSVIIIYRFVDHQVIKVKTCTYFGKLQFHVLFGWNRVEVIRVRNEKTHKLLGNSKTLSVTAK